MLDYWTDIENVTITNLEKNKFIISNNSNEPINGFSIAVEADQIYVDNKIPAHKYYLGDLICWFDLKPKEKMVLTLITEKE
jgi:hypothetical protein